MTVKSLFDTCLDFVANNVHHIDSLDGFPDEFGGKIFERALSHGNLDLDTFVSQCSIRLYGEADYWREVKIPNLLLLNEYDISMLHLIKYTVKLDLSNVTLDDDHDILTALPDCDNLKVLILESTCISDKGLKKIIYPCFGGRKLPSLEYLDLSGLDLTIKILNNLRHLTQLQTILLFSDQITEKIKQFRQASRPDIQMVTNSLLLTKLLVHWSRNLSQRKLTERTPNIGFYSTKDKISEKSNVPLKLKTKRNKVMFNREKQSADLQNLTSSNCKKRAREENEVPTQRLKNQKMEEKENTKIFTNINSILDCYR